MRIRGEKKLACQNIYWNVNYFFIFFSASRENGSIDVKKKLMLMNVCLFSFISFECFVKRYGGYVLRYVRCSRVSKGWEGGWWLGRSTQPIKNIKSYKSNIASFFAF